MKEILIKTEQGKLPSWFRSNDELLLWPLYGRGGGGGGGSFLPPGVDRILVKGLFKVLLVVTGGKETGHEDDDKSTAWDSGVTRRATG